jgi:hypothetical protein
MPLPGQQWQHYKGNVYTVLATAVNEHSGREQVVYQSTSGGTVWVRDVADWVALVTVSEGVQVRRFTCLSEQQQVDTVERVEFEDTQPAPPRCVPVQQDTETVAP